MDLGVGVIVGVGVSVDVNDTVGVGVAVEDGLLSDDNPLNTTIPSSRFKSLNLMAPVIIVPDGERSMDEFPTATVNLFGLNNITSFCWPEFSTVTISCPCVEPIVEFKILDFNCT